MFDIFNKIIETKHQAEFAKSFFNMVNSFQATDPIFKVALDHNWNTKIK